MDDTAGTFLRGATISKFRIYAQARFQSSGSGLPISEGVDLGYRTGTNTVWSGEKATVSDYGYTLIDSAEFTTDSDGSALDSMDIDNLQIVVKRITNNRVWQLLVTEVYVDVEYTP
jgi:hypothetical protein